MCASYESRFNVRQLVDLFSQTGLELTLPGGAPNLEPRDEVRPTDPDRAVRAAPGAAGGLEYAPMRFGFPPAPQGPQGRKRPPVINFRSEGRRITNGPTSGRALVPVSGFYEFTGDKYPKTRWRFSDAGGAPFLALAALWRAGPPGTEAGDAFALLTAEPGADVAPYHDRGVIPMPPEAWADWLLDRRPAEDLLTPPPAGILAVEHKPRA